jgi:hypothetical protein
MASEIGFDVCPYFYICSKCFHQVLRAGLESPDSPEATEFDWGFYLVRLNELHEKNIALAAGLRQRLDRMQLEPNHDMLSQFFQHGSVGHSPRTNPPYNEKNERKMLEEFQNHASVYQEKVRRQVVSLEREIEANKNLVLRKQTDRAEMFVRLKDSRSETQSQFQHLVAKRKRFKKWKMAYERVSQQLSCLQDQFVPDVVVHSESPLDGMRRNINRLLVENKDLSHQLFFLNKQARLYDAKLRGVRCDLVKSGALLHERQLAATHALASSRELTCELTGSVTPRVSVGFVKPTGPYSLPQIGEPLMGQVGIFFADSNSFVFRVSSLLANLRF